MKCPQVKSLDANQITFMGIPTRRPHLPLKNN